MIVWLYKQGEHMLQCILSFLSYNDYMFDRSITFDIYLLDEKNDY